MITVKTKENASLLMALVAAIIVAIVMVIGGMAWWLICCVAVGVFGKRRAQLLTEHRGEVQGCEGPAISCEVDGSQEGAGFRSAGPPAGRGCGQPRVACGSSGDGACR